MMKKFFNLGAAALFMIAFAPLILAQDTPPFDDGSERLADFEGAIGVDPVSGIIMPEDGTGASTPVPIPRSNIVRGVSPGGLPWVIEDFECTVGVNGEISDCKGEGLLLSGGDPIGTIGGVSSVLVTLFCGPPSAESVEPPTQEPSAQPTAHSSMAFPLAADGDFEVEGMLTPAPSVPCDSPVLLVRNGTFDDTGSPDGSWFAAGILDDLKEGTDTGTDDGGSGGDTEEIEIEDEPQGRGGRE